VAGYFYVLAISNVGYILFNFLNLNAGWIHRIDSPNAYRPWRAPTVLIAINTVLAFVNALFPRRGRQGLGLLQRALGGLIFAALIIPVFWFRHYVQDGGRFPGACTRRARRRRRATWASGARASALLRCWRPSPRGALG
jgi:amino acid transporter